MNENDNMVSRSVYVRRVIWDEAISKSNRPNIKRSMSQIVDKLLELWIDGKVTPYPESELVDNDNN